MHIVVAYESMYGNTRQVADAIASAFPTDDEVTLTSINKLDVSTLRPDLLVVGTPTHAHGLPRPASRDAAVASAQSTVDPHDVEAEALAPGVREWLAALPANVPCRVAAFDTRFRPPAWLTGHPARAILRTLVRHGATPVAGPESFFVDKHERVRAGEIERACEWGALLAQAVHDRELKVLS